MPRDIKLMKNKFYKPQNKKPSLTKIHKLCSYFWKFIFKKGRRKYLDNHFQYIYIKTIAKLGNQQQAETTDKVIEIIVVNIFPQK